MTAEHPACLPGYLSPPQHILVDPEVSHLDLTRRVLSRLPGVPWSTGVSSRKAAGSFSSPYVLHLKYYRGSFLRFCPGTKHYHCCGYRIIHIGENCPLHCNYCILQAYFQDPILKVWANQEDLYRELEASLQPRDKLFRVGTGEFTDSLALEPITGYTRDLLGFLNAFPNVCLELKSKIVDLTWMDQVQNPSRVLPAWSVNSPEVIATEEKGTAPLESRLQAARNCADSGFRVCLHFDPIIHYPGWQQGYHRAVEMIFDYLNPQDIAYLSLGSFRFMPELENILISKAPGARYVYNEFITGLDGKKRLLLPLRLEQFAYIANRLKRYGLKEQIYFCMESSRVWKDVLGYTPRDLGGLDKHLIRLSFGSESL